MKARGALLVATGLLLAGAGCGYQFVSYAEPPSGIRSVAIRTPRNDSYEPGIELVVADALRREFLRRGGVTLSEDPQAADLVLSGTVRRIRTRSQSFSSVALALEWEVTLQLSIRATRRNGSVIPIEEESLQETERFLASPDVEAERKNRDEALRRVADVLAARVHDIVYEVYTP